MPAISKTAPHTAARLGPASYFWLSAAVLLALIIIGRHSGWSDWLYTRFPDQVTTITALMLSGIISFIAIRQVLPMGSSIGREQHAMDNLVALLDRRHDDPCEAVTQLIDCRFDENEDTATAQAVADLGEHVRTCIALGTTPSLSVEEAYGGFAGRLEAIFPRLGFSRTILVTLGLLGTIVGFVLVYTSQQQMPNTAEENKAFIFLLYHGMGTVYASAVLGWGGYLWLSIFEAIIRRNADDLGAMFWSRLAGFVMPVIRSEKFSTHRRTPSA